MYVGTQQVYPGGQSGVVVIQPSGAVATVSHGYSMAGQQTFVIPPQVTNALSSMLKELCHHQQTE